MSTVQEVPADVKAGATKSGAAGSAQFPGSESRKYNYFEPKGRKATHYEDMTLDVQPDPKRYLLQDWIMSFADGTPTYFEGWTVAKSSDWHKFRAVDQEWERTHFQRQSTIIGMISNVVSNGRRAGTPGRFDKTWTKVLPTHLGAFKHAEFGLGTALMYAQRYGYTQMINSAILTNSSYKLRFAQDLALYLGELALDIEDFNVGAGKAHWIEDPTWQGTRKLIETIGGISDPLETYFAVNFCFEPLVGELFRSGFVMQAAASQNDFMTPAVVGAAESDYERNLTNTAELFTLLASDEKFGPQNRELFAGWMAEYGQLALDAAQLLQPIWSQPRVKVANFTEALDAAKNRVRAIGAAVGFDAASFLPA